MIPSDEPVDNDGFTDFLRTRGDLGRRLLSLDGGWPPVLRATLRLLLGSRLPVLVVWGPELVCFYNEPYIAFLGDKHPASLGAPMPEVWPELWPDIGRLVERTFEGEALLFEDQPFVIHRDGEGQRIRVTFSYTPIHDGPGPVAGLWCTVTDTTDRVLNEQRLAFQLQLADALRGLSRPIDILDAASRLTGEYFKVGRVGYADIDEDRGTASVDRDWNDGKLGSLAGESRPLASFGQALIDELRHGNILRIDDVGTDARAHRYAAGYASIGARALLVVPLLENGRLTAVFYLHEGTARRWTDEEAMLIEDVARRTWDAVRRARSEETLREESHVLETLNETGRLLASTLDINTLLQRITDAATRLTGAQFGSFFYNGVDVNGEALMLYTLSGAPRSAFEGLGHPRPTPVFKPTFVGEGPVRSDDITLDPRYGRMGPHFGMPAGHLPVRSYLAVSVVSRTGEVLGGLFFGHSEPGVFTARTEHLLTAVAAQAAVAIDNARLYEQEQHSARERAALLESERAARSEAERLSLLKDEFLAMLAHELRNPLAPISSSAAILDIFSGEDDRLRRISDIIGRQVEHMTRLIDDLLDVSRVTRGLITLDRRDLDFRRIVDGALDQARPLFESKRQRVLVDLPPRPVPVDGDATRLIQVVANILNNAAKYTQDEGTIDIGLAAGDGRMTLSVRDNGSGMPPDLVPMVFELFTQGSRTLARSQGGLGLGLTLVRRLVELHGGSVAAASPGLNRGSEFTVTLPLSGAAAKADDTVADMPVADMPVADMPVADMPVADMPVRSWGRLLVVDDNRDAADSLAALLRACGYEVTVEYRALAGLERAAAAKPDVILVDIGLPDLDGYALAARLKSLPETRRARLIAVTGYGRPEDRERSRKAGFDVHLVKPVDMIGLRQALRELEAGEGGSDRKETRPD